MEKKLSIGKIYSEGISMGLIHAPAIIVNAILWALTIWIPYLNVGTTIAMATGIVAKVSKGETISMTEVFKPEYRRYMGEYFLTSGLISAGAAFGFMLFIAPGYVIMIAWSLALLLVVDQGKNPMEALSLSNNATYGNKMTMFLAKLILIIALGIIITILSRIPGIGSLLAAVVMLTATFAVVGIDAYIYKTLCGTSEEGL